MRSAVAGRTMVVPLEREKLVDGPYRDRVRALKSHFPTSRQGPGGVPDARSTGRHHGGSRDVPTVYQARQPELSPGKRPRDEPQVRPDLGHSGRVARVTLQADAPAVGQRPKVVEGGVLVDTHDDMAAGLDLCKCAVG